MSIDRRKFIQSSLLTAAAVASTNVAAISSKRSSNEKLNLAFVGVGGRGRHNLKALSVLEDVNIAFMCDVDSDNLSKGAEQYSVPHAATYRDFRVMLEEEPNIDAVVISTPDHTHAVIAMAAIKKGKHVYCEKPLTHTLHEARKLARAAKVAGVATQMGNQGMAFEGNRLLKEWLADGAIGTVREAHVWSDRPTTKGGGPLWWAQGIERPKDTPPTPDQLDWDLWLGPAPERPYHPAYVPKAWRGWWDFGSGGLGDMGVHNIAPVFDALQLDAPESVSGSSTPVFEETLPLASTVKFSFPARGSREAVDLHWYDGGLLPPRPDELEDGRELNHEDGILLVGEEGKILVTGWGGLSPRLIPESRQKAYKRPPRSLPRSIGHYAEWVKACRDGGETASSFDFAGPLTETLAIGSICTRLGGGKLHWDSTSLSFIGNDNANTLINPPMRSGWSL